MKHCEPEGKKHKRKKKAKRWKPSQFSAEEGSREPGSGLERHTAQSRHGEKQKDKSNCSGDIARERHKRRGTGEERHSGSWRLPLPRISFRRRELDSIHTVIHYDKFALPLAAGVIFHSIARAFVGVDCSPSLVAFAAFPVHAIAGFAAASLFVRTSFSSSGLPLAPRVYLRVPCSRAATAEAPVDSGISSSRLDPRPWKGNFRRGTGEKEFAKVFEDANAGVTSAAGAAALRARLLQLASLVWGYSGRLAAAVCLPGIRRIPPGCSCILSFRFQHQLLRGTSPEKALPDGRRREAGTGPGGRYSRKDDSGSGPALHNQKRTTGFSGSR
ncbi:hypothetical protein BESB_080640 [Besnoitia besnoiti]|uniref:Uncharacterized protein n=1 Tax=Besnoitia besnoiti TaxID=94643 RepID=A0A2A9M5U7_BESBE|nr:hypothetical protein BESB_080640 [Besnoitia besnoiti]PFH33848.1 hypothetical protein BESB_080640 [Besnoitia besnoiti]